jgi:hypothetical protein
MVLWYFIFEAFGSGEWLEVVPVAQTIYQIPRVSQAVRRREQLF